MNKSSIVMILSVFLIMIFVSGCTNDTNNNLYNKREAVVDSEIKINKDEINNVAKFYSILIDDIEMEVIAVQATDETVRVAFNACNICASSGKGHYVQEGNYFVCQNCGTKIFVDQVGIGAGGCNPVSLDDDEKYEEDGYIVIPYETLNNYKDLFIY